MFCLSFWLLSSVDFNRLNFSTREPTTFEKNSGATQEPRFGSPVGSSVFGDDWESESVFFASF